jgi:hypothetical protein
MKNYLSCRTTSGRALLALVLLAAGGCLVAKAGSFLPEATNSVPQRTLTFADRVAYQRAMEEVYWQHRIWPKENPRPKPSLDEVMTQRTGPTEGGRVFEHLAVARRSMAAADHARPVAS